MSCPKCQASIPEGMRFCLQCGAALTFPAPSAPGPAQADSPDFAARQADLSVANATDSIAETEADASYPAPTSPPAVPLKLSSIPPSFAPPAAPASSARIDRGDPDLEEVDDELLKKSFERRGPRRPGAVVCRFCKAPLDINGDFCDQCGAPVAEAAPEGLLKDKSQHAVSSGEASGGGQVIPGDVTPGSSGNPKPSEAAPIPSPGSRPPADPPLATTPASSETTPPSHQPSGQPGVLGRIKSLFRIS